MKVAQIIKIKSCDRIEYRPLESSSQGFEHPRGLLTSFKAPKESLLNLRFLPDHIKSNRSDQDRAFNDLLHEIAHVQKRHSIVETCHDQCAQAGAEHRAAAAHQTGAADHAR